MPTPLTIERYTKPGQGSVNSYILVSESSIALIDTQRTLPEARELLAKMQATGKPLEAIVLSHEHPDHIGGVKLILDHYPGVPVYASQTTIDYITREKEPLVKLMKGFFADAFADDIPVPDQVLADGDVIQLAGIDWSVQELGAGEASSMLLLHSSDQDILFCADTVGNHMTAWVGDQHVDAWLAQLDDLGRRYGAVGTVYPGHGDAGPPSDMFAPQQRFLRFFRDLVRKELNGGSRLDEDAIGRIKSGLEAEYPIASYPGVAGFPFLADWNAGAMAAELAHRDWSVFTAEVPPGPDANDGQGASAAAPDAMDVSARFARPVRPAGEAVSPEVQRANLAIAREFVERGLGQGDMDAFDRLVSPQVWVSTGLKPGGPITSRDEYKAVIGATLGRALSFENADLMIEDALVTTDGRAIIRFTSHADHAGELDGVAPTGRRLTLAETHLFRIEDGLIVENYVGALNPMHWEMIYSDGIKREQLA
jgi:glyoxylase-like metal-dependent hydrolase (beta-lactamase superfamily II)